MLLEEGADVHWQDKDGYTALHIAAGYVHNSVVRALLEAGANPEEEDLKGRSPLLLAQELLERTPRNNPMQFARRMALDQVLPLPFPFHILRENHQLVVCFHSWFITIESMFRL